MGRFRFFNFRKEWVDNFTWALMSKPAATVFIVIGRHMNRKGYCCPSIKTLMDETGRSKPIVIQGIYDLQMQFAATDGFKASRNRSRKLNNNVYNFAVSEKYNEGFPPNPIRNKTFPFFVSIVEEHIWASMTSPAHKLYVVMRRFSTINPDLVYEDYENSGDPNLECEDALEFNENLKYFDAWYCEKTKKFLMEYSGLNDKRTFYKAIDDLNDNYLLDRANGIWKVYKETKFDIERRKLRLCKS